MENKKQSYRKSLAGLYCILSIFGGAAMAAETGAAQATKSQYKVIFHVDSESKVAMNKTLSNIRNLYGDPRLKGKLQVELIANSKGYLIYKKGNGLEDTLKELVSKGVVLAECSNTLRELKVDRDSLYSFIEIVPSGVGELVIKEGDGWAYIHPTE